MDTTDEYIEMCKKAVQIQQTWKKTIGDYFYNPPYYSPNNVSIIFDSYIRNKEEGREYYGGTYSNNERVLDGSTWLPRQDQLQDFLNWEHDGTYGVVLIDAFYNFSKMNYKTYLFNNTKMTWEQLWLTFVMYKKYNKVWNGSEWVGI